LNGRLELDHWIAAGVPLRHILRAATLDNAETFGLASDRGTIQVGKRDDFLLLSEDPLKSVKAYGSIERVILNGKVIRRGDLLAPKT
jgi:imidazolonepropionase-like amidohydrolase